MKLFIYYSFNKICIMNILLFFCCCCCYLLNFSWLISSNEIKFQQNKFLFINAIKNKKKKRRNRYLSARCCKHDHCILKHLFF